MARVMIAVTAAAAVLGFASAPFLRTAVAEAPCGRVADAAYVGSKSCFKCHFKEHGSWTKKAHAKALEVLKPGQAAEAKTKAKLDPAKDYTADPSCVGCHTTGYGKPGGYPEVGKEWTAEEKARAPLLAGVGCESCHGPGEKSNAFKVANKEYKWAEVEALGMVKPTEALCKGCHNEKSPTYKPFDFEARKKDGVHDLFPLKFKHD